MPQGRGARHPEQVAAKEGFYTGRFLADIVKPAKPRARSRAKVAAAA